LSNESPESRSLRRMLALGLVFHEAVAVRLGINATDLKCLELAAGEESVTPTRLAELAGLTSGAITGVLDRLERAGIISRGADPADRRRVVVRVEPDRLDQITTMYRPVVDAARGSDAASRRAARQYLDTVSTALEHETARLRAASHGGMVDDRYVAPLMGATRGRLVVISGAPRLSMTAAPFGPQAVARVVMETSASRLSLSGGTAPDQLATASFEGPAPDVRVTDGTVTVRYRRPRLDMRSRRARISLNRSIPWAVEISGGVTDFDADLRDVALSGLQLNGGVNHLRLELGPPSGTVRLEINGSASDARMGRPPGTDVALRVRGVLSNLLFDDEKRDTVGGELRMQSRGFGRATDRYEIDMSGGAARLTIDTL
jgi:DNA-binding MarR family transcriptional regulator